MKMPPMTSLLPRFEATIERKGVVVQPDGDANEVEGVLNPASTRALTGELLLYPRCVARGNISRIGLMKGRTRGDRVLFERLGFALEPAMAYELRPPGMGGMGCEDPRVTFVPILGRYVMAYTAFGPSGPRIVFALSADGYAWERLGLVDFAAHGLTDGDDKDAAFFPEPVHSPAGVLSLAFYHRPMRRISTADGHAAIPTLLDLPANERECTRIAYVPLAAVQDDVRNLLRPAESRIVLAPDGPWGRLKTGGGTPPVRIAEGWLSFFHAVDALEVDGRFAMTYSAGIVVHDGDEPHLLRYRSPRPVLAPSTADELHGIVSNVVFPTGIDVRGERSFDVYYGMADAKIGRASVELAAVPYASGSAIASRNSEPSAPASARNAS
jgi:beta-1,2-mannobiose phosphorylase / 1,2-beta-oligomannan phosphorylase